MIDTPNTGLRRRINLEGEQYYLTVTAGPDGHRIDITCGPEVPPHSRVRRIIEAIADNINTMINEVNHAGA